MEGTVAYARPRNRANRRGPRARGRDPQRRPPSSAGRGDLAPRLTRVTVRRPRGPPAQPMPAAGRRPRRSNRLTPTRSCRPRISGYMLEKVPRAPYVFLRQLATSAMVHSLRNTSSTTRPSPFGCSFFRRMVERTFCKTAPDPQRRADRCPCRTVSPNCCPRSPAWRP